MNQRNSEYRPIGNESFQFLQSGGDEEIHFKIYGLKKHFNRTFIFHLTSILLLGIPYILLAWLPKYKTLKYIASPFISADYVFIKDDFDKCSLSEISDSDICLSGKPQHIRSFVHQHNKYIWHRTKANFVTLEEFTEKISLNDLLEDSHGLLDEEQKTLYNLYGPNKVEVEVKSYWRLFVEEVFNPFYIFQAFSVTLWFFDDYIIYAGCVFFLTLFSITTALFETRKQSVALHKLVESSNSTSVQVVRRNFIDRTTLTIDPSELTPGELLIVPRTGCVMPCDAVLLTGNCIVNESMLTGESVPVMKTPPNASSEMYNPNIHKAHTLFSGTHVIQGRFYGEEHILARVTKTGFETTKGALVKSIMFPSPIGFKFYRDSMKFLLVLFCVAAIGMSYCLYLYILREAPIREIVIRTLDIITIVVPPALPAAMTVGIVYSQNRLKKLGIFCISPPRINVAGKLKLACFDKTGTLTNEGLELYSVLPTVNGRFDEAVQDVKLLDATSPMVQAMATCHSLTRIEGKLNGDPLDLNMFENTKWILDEPGDEETNYDMLAPTIVKPENKYVSSSQLMGGSGDVEMPYEIGIIRQMQFSSALQRMSVICRVLGSPNMVIYTKGAPEKIITMCQYDSIPPDFNTKLAEYTAQGFRVIAVAHKPLPRKFKWKEALKVKREMVECELTFIGFIVMQNTLKPETTPVISILHAANIRTVMITGDNVMTAVCVARECGMVRINDDVVLLRVHEQTVDVIPRIYIENICNTNNVDDQVINFDDNHYHFAMDGTTWSALRTFYPDLLSKLLLRTTIFARFQPDQKTQLIATLQTLDYIVSMVGDGANDCGALKAAHIGISLSQAEASVAAPFTSSIENISCLIHLMMEGRCALVTSFSVFKYMALYSLIQFFTIIILYKNNSILGDQQFLFIDLVITTTLAVTMGRQGPSNKLVAKRPMGSLISGSNLFPMVLQIICCGLTQLGALYYLSVQDWYRPNPRKQDEIILCWENTVLFTVSCFQYVALALVYSQGKPYRKSLITNAWLLISVLTLATFTTYLSVYPDEKIADFFELIYLPLDTSSKERYFKDYLILFPIAHFFIAVLIEFFIAESVWVKSFIHFISCKKRPKNKYKILMQQTDFSRWFHYQDNRNELIQVDQENRTETSNRRETSNRHETSNRNETLR